MDLKCEKCGLNLGEMELGRIRKNSVMLCVACWKRASRAMETAELSARDTPGFLKDLFSGFGKK